MDTCSLDTGAPRAATTLVPRLRAATPNVRNVWRGDEWINSGINNGAGIGSGAAPDGASTGFTALDRELPTGGWPRGQLVELLVDHPGVGELGLLLPALAALARTGRSCVWVLPCQQGAAHAADAASVLAMPYAPALAEAGLDLAHHIFVKPLTARESGWALEQSLRTPYLGALIGWLPDTTGADADFRELRRLHLLAQKHGALVFVLRTARHARSPSPAALRLRLNSEGGQLQVQILKRRGRPLLEPIALQVHPARWNSVPAGIVPHASGTGAATTGPLPPLTVSPETDIVIDKGTLAQGKAAHAPAPGIALDARVSGTAAATGTAAAWRLPTLRRLMRAIAPQRSWSMPAALSRSLAPASAA